LCCWDSSYQALGLGSLNCGLRYILYCVDTLKHLPILLVCTIHSTCRQCRATLPAEGVRSDMNTGEHTAQLMAVEKRTVWSGFTAICMSMIKSACFCVPSIALPTIFFIMKLMLGDHEIALTTLKKDVSALSASMISLKKMSNWSPYGADVFACRIRGATPRRSRALL
jgi:hypothetical protein